MKKQMRNVTRTIWALRNMLAVFCVAAVLYGVSFVCHADTVKGTITGTSVNVRESASTTAEALESLTTNDLVDVIAETTGDDGMKWYKITTESGVTGYVRSDLIKKATVTVDVTQTESKTAYIAGSNANIRQDASTSSGRVANARGGSQVTIIGEATGADGYKWYQIEFVGNGTTMTGFIRSDLVTFQAPVQEPEITEIEGEMGEEEPESNSEEYASEMTSEEDTSEPANTDIPADGDSGDLTIMEPVSALEVIPEGFEQTQLQLGEDTFTVWGKGQFYIIYASVNGAEPQYYFYDTVHKSYVAYDGLLPADDVTAPEEKEGFNYKLVAIICIVVIAILLMVVVIMGYKLANAGYRDDDDDDDDDDYYEDDDDEEDDEDDYVDLSDDIYTEETVAAPVEDSLEYEDATIQMPVESINAVQEEYYAETETVQETAYMPEEAVVQSGYAAETTGEEIYVSETDDTENDGIVYEEDTEDDYEEEEEEQLQPKKAKLSKRLLDFFTVEVEEDDDDDDDEDEEEQEEPQKRKKAKKARKEQESLFDDDEDDDLNFIDL